MDFNTLNELAHKPYPTTIRMKEFIKGERYMVVELKKANTKYGMKIVAVFEENQQVFLPGSISKAFIDNEDLFNEMCNKANKLKLYLTYLGDVNIEFM